MESMSLSSGSRSVVVYIWNFSTQGELFTSSYVHDQDVRQSVVKIFAPVAASHSSLCIIWGIKLLAQTTGFRNGTDQVIFHQKRDDFSYQPSFLCLSVLLYC